MKEIRTASHLAVLDPFTGEGSLVLPRPNTDVCDPEHGMASLNTVDGQAMMRELDALGFEFSEDDDGLPIVNGFTDAGRMILGLWCAEPIYTDAPFGDCVQASAEIARLVGVL